MGSNFQDLLRSQFFTIQVSQPENNIKIIGCSLVLLTLSIHVFFNSFFFFLFVKINQLVRVKTKKVNQELIFNSFNFFF